jgi:SHS2 domain-containing protein
MTDPSEIPIPGVSALEHTADVGLAVDAATLPELFQRAALGAMWLVLEREPMSRSQETRPLQLVEADLPALFRSWLRTLLFWEETDGFVVKDMVLSFAPAPLCSARDGQAFGLHSRVMGVLDEEAVGLHSRIMGVLDEGPRVREVKGVTLHGLTVERGGEGWLGRVIFDV